MFDGADLVYMFDGSFEGFLTCVHRVYYSREAPALLTTEEGFQQFIGQRCLWVETDFDKYQKVFSAIRQKIGRAALWKIYNAFLFGSGWVDLLHYIQLGFRLGDKITLFLANDVVDMIEKRSKKVESEAHLLKGFLRFSQLENHVFYGKITPKYYVLPLLMPHFADRFKTMPFIIHDEAHRQAGVFDLKDWQIVDSKHFELPALAENEEQFQALWKLFYDTVAIRERENRRCKITHMPKRFWGNMCEMQGEA